MDPELRSDFCLLLLLILIFAVLFLCLLLILFALMTYLVLYPAPIISKYLQLCDISDMNYKLLLVALAALNLLICFVAEVSVDI